MTKFKRKTQKATAILSADWHIRPDTPVCRQDNFFAAMEKKIDFILDLSKEHDCPILIAGDLGHKAQWPNWLLEWAIHKFKGHDIICIPGQHDLPNHRLDLFEKSGLGVLTAAKAIKTIGLNDFTHNYKNSTIEIAAFPYGKEIKEFYGERKKEINWPLIAMTHQMVIDDKRLWPDQEAPEGHSLLKKFPEYQIILSGDNHQAFTVEHEGRHLVNPGSLMRSTAAQEDHKPRVYLWYADTNDIEAVYLPIEQGVISRTHIDIAKERENRNEAFITRVNSDTEVELSFETNLERYFQKYRTKKEVVEKTWEAVK